MEPNAPVVAQKTQMRPTKRPNVFTCVGIVLIIFVILLCGIGSVGAYIYITTDGRGYNINNLLSRTNTNNSQNSSNKDIDDLVSKDVYNANGDIVNIVDKASPAVVTVLVKSPSNNKNLTLEKRETIASGTGFFITQDGTLITNEHVVCGANASDLLIVTSDEKTYSVNSASVDSAQDVAILQVNTGDTKVTALKFANPNSKIKPGQQVIAIGNPFGDNPGSVTEGIISGINRNVSAYGSCGTNSNEQKDYEGVIQTDAAINSGNSGGPLLNMNGEVVGVNSATLRSANNISYTVPYTTVLKILDRYYKNGNQIVSPFLGVTHRIVDATDAGLPAGAQVLGVQSGSSADKAGVKVGDIITKIGDKKLNFSLVATLNQYFEPGQKTTLTIYRPTEGEANKGQTLTLDITIGTRPSSL